MGSLKSSEPSTSHPGLSPKKRKEVKGGYRKPRQKYKEKTKIQFMGDHLLRVSESVVLAN